MPVAVLKPAASGGGVDIFYIWADHLGTPRLITDAANNSRWEWPGSDPFGNNTPNENPAGLGVFAYNLRFPGQYFDPETGLSYNYFRDYDPKLGRYVQSDPIGLNGGLNTYGYVAGNPLSVKDAFGLFDPGDFIKPAAQVCTRAGTGVGVAFGIALAAAGGMAYSPDAGSACDDDIWDNNSSCKEDKCEKAKREARRIYNELTNRSIPQYMYHTRHGDADEGHYRAIQQGQASLQNALSRVRRYCKPLPTEYEKWDMLANQNFPVRH